MNSKLLIAKRRKLGMTQQDLANACGISKNTIYNYENNKSKPTSENLTKLAEILDVNEVELLDNFTDVDLNEVLKIRDSHEKQLLEHINKLANKDNDSTLAKQLLESFKDLSGFDVIYLPKLECVILIKGESKIIKYDLNIFDYHMKTFIYMSRSFGAFDGEILNNKELFDLFTREIYCW